MSVTIYIWHNAAGDPDHASMQVGAHYVSYWPKGKSGKQRNWPKSGAGPKDFKVGTTHPPSFPRKLEMDCRLEGRQADNCLILNGLDESTMVDLWLEMKASKVPYNMVANNCSTIVAILLQAGSGVVPAFPPTISIGESIPRPVPRMLMRLRFLGDTIPMWSPNAVLSYAQQINIQVAPV